MGAFGPIHWIIVAAVVMLMFGGRGKLSGLMGDAAKGIRAFQDGMKGEPEQAAHKRDVLAEAANGDAPRSN